FRRGTLGRGLPVQGQVGHEGARRVAGRAGAAGAGPEPGPGCDHLQRAARGRGEPAAPADRGVISGSSRLFRCPMIAFVCPNPDCRAKYRVPDDRAGKTTVCANPRCGLRIQVPVPPPPPPPVVADLLDEETGATIKDWRSEPPHQTAAVP